MLQRLLPEKIDNQYRGHPIALWFFVPITLMTLWRSLVHVLRADGGAQSIATIPLDTYPEAAATTIVVVFSLWGLHQLVLGLLYVLALLRYRALIPLFYVLLLVEYVGRLVLGSWKGPIETISTPPGARLNVIMIFASCVLLWLSLRNHEARSVPAANEAANA